MRHESTTGCHVACGHVLTGVEVPAVLVLHWDRDVRWDASAVTVRAIRDYLLHDLPGPPACGGCHE